ncbi:MAG: mannose-6-phosphate isomerase, class I [Saprospiraceae bacterium]
MNQTTTARPITGAIQHYAWGGTDYLPQLLGRSNSDNQPWAELWLGTHPKGTARLEAEERTLADLIAEDPNAMLGEEVADKYGDQLPFLLKVLDVKQMLSIQTHPERGAAKRGFRDEEKAGIARDAPDRNFRDRNHKPELAVALTEFYLLHGFRPTADIRASLEAFRGWEVMLPLLEKEGITELYRHVMQLDQREVNQLLSPLQERLGKMSADVLDKEGADYWAAEAFRQYTDEEGNYDRGIFSVYWLNIVRLHPGEGIFQAAGIPHAYLRGACIELMANSDNVLRGGLTKKHIDVPQLLTNLNFSSIEPHHIQRVLTVDNWRHYPTPAEDFQLSVRQFNEGEVVEENDMGPAIYLVMSGSVQLDDNTVLFKGQSCFLPAGAVMELAAQEFSTIYRASVGERPNQEEHDARLKK